MELITIDGISYNLAHLVCLSYKQDTKAVMREGKGPDKGRKFPTGEMKFPSVLRMRFMECSEIVFLDDAADAAWRTLLDVLKPSPIAVLVTRIPRPEPS